MSLLLLDSFDHYATADIERKWTQLYPTGGAAGATTTISTGTGRRDTNSIRFRNPGGGAACEAIAFVPQVPQTTECIIGFAFKASGVGAFVSNANGDSQYPWLPATSLSPRGTNVIAQVRSGTHTMIGFLPLSNGKIAVYRGDYTSTNAAGMVYLGETANALSPNQWHFLEFKVLVHASAGTVDIMVDGVSELSLSGIATWLDPTVGSFLPAPPVGWDEVVIGHLTSGVSAVVGIDAGLQVWDVDDLYIANGDSVVTNDVDDFWGDHRIDVRRVEDDGAMTQMTPAAGSDHWDMVDDLTPDDDATYNSEATAGQIDTFVVENAIVTGQPVAAVQVLHLARRSAEGNSSTKAVLRSGGVNYSGDLRGNPSTYQYHWGIWTKDPSDNGEISDTDWNAMEIGVEKET